MKEKTCPSCFKTFDCKGDCVKIHVMEFIDNNVCLCEDCLLEEYINSPDFYDLDGINIQCYSLDYNKIIAHVL